MLYALLFEAKNIDLQNFICFTDFKFKSEDISAVYFPAPLKWSSLFSNNTLNVVNVP